MPHFAELDAVRLLSEERRLPVIKGAISKVRLVLVFTGGRHNVHSVCQLVHVEKLSANGLPLPTSIIKQRSTPIQRTAATYPSNLNVRQSSMLRGFSIGKTDRITLANIRNNRDSTAYISDMKIRSFARERHKQELVKRIMYWKGVCRRNFRRDTRS